MRPRRPVARRRRRACWGIGVDADQGYLGTHVLTSATKKVDVAVFKTIAGARKAGAAFKDGFDAIFIGQERRRRLRQDLAQGAQPSWKKAVEPVRAQIATGKIKVTADDAASRTRARADRLPEGAGFEPAPSRFRTARMSVAGGLAVAPARPLVAGAARARAAAAATTTRRRRRTTATDDRRRRPTTAPDGDVAQVGLVTDIGGLDDRSFNFLANQGLERARVASSASRAACVISRANADYVPNLSSLAQRGLRPRDRASAS